MEYQRIQHRFGSARYLQSRSTRYGKSILRNPRLICIVSSVTQINPGYTSSSYEPAWCSAAKPRAPRVHLKCRPCYPYAPQESKHGGLRDFHSDQDGRLDRRSARHRIRRNLHGRVRAWLSAGLFIVFRTCPAGVYAWSLTDDHIL